MIGKPLAQGSSAMPAASVPGLARVWEGVVHNNQPILLVAQEPPKKQEKCLLPYKGSIGRIMFYSFGVLKPIVV